MLNTNYDIEMIPHWLP